MPVLYSLSYGYGTFWSHQTLPKVDDFKLLKGRYNVSHQRRTVFSECVITQIKNLGEGGITNNILGYTGVPSGEDSYWVLWLRHWFRHSRSHSEASRVLPANPASTTRSHDGHVMQGVVRTSKTSARAFAPSFSNLFRPLWKTSRANLPPLSADCWWHWSNALASICTITKQEVSVGLFKKKALKYANL